MLKAQLVLQGQEPPRSHSLQRLLQELAAELLDLDDFALLARFDASPTPLPAGRSRLLELLEELHMELQQRIS